MKRWASTESPFTRNRLVISSTSGTNATKAWAPIDSARSVPSIAGIAATIATTVWSWYLTTKACARRAGFWVHLGSRLTSKSSSLSRSPPWAAIRLATSTGEPFGATRGSGGRSVVAIGW